MNKIKDGLPRTALALYIKLFCKKRGNKIMDKNILIEATKSWLLLNKSDKQKFLKKYEDYQTNYKKAFADYLATAEPYLKVKNKIEKEKPGICVIEENHLDKQKTVESTTQNIDTKHMELDIDQNEYEHGDNGNNEINNTMISSNNGDGCNRTRVVSPIMEHTNNTNNKVQYNEISIVEPTPPKFIKGQQLFEMIHENDNNLVWAKLETAEKSKYQRAVLLIKKKYLMEYKNYLEGLSSEKLYRHYKRMV